MSTDAPLGIIRNELVRPPQRVRICAPDGLGGEPELFGYMVRRDILAGFPLTITVELRGGVELTCPAGWIAPATDWHSLLDIPRDA